MKPRKGLLIGGTVVLVIILVVLVLPFVIDANQFRPTLERQLQTTLGRSVRIGDLSISLIAGGVRAKDVSIAEDPQYGRDPFLKTKSLDVGVEFLPLIFSRSLHVNSITLREPELHLVRGNGGKWNFSSLGGVEADANRARHGGKAAPAPSTEPGSQATSLSIGVFRIVDGKILVSNIGDRSQPHVYDDVQLKASDIGFGSVMPFTFEANTPGGGRLNLDGKAGPIDRTNAAATPMNAHLVIKHVDLASTGFLDSSSGLAGLLDYDGSVQSNGSIAETQGAAKVDKLRLVKAGAPARQPVTFDYATDYDLKRQAGTLTRGDIRTGKTAAKLSGNYLTQGDSTILHMKFSGNNMPVHEVEGLLPAFGVVLPAGSSLQGGSVSANLGLDGPLDHLVITGPLNVSNTQLVGFNLASKMAAIAQLAGVRGGNETDIQTLSSTLRMSPEGIRADALNLVLPQLGVLTGNGTIGANHALDFRMTAKLAHGGGVLGSLSQLSTLGQSQGDLPFLIQGTTSDPIFVPDVGKALGNTVGAPVKGVGGLLGLFGTKKQ